MANNPGCDVVYGDSVTGDTPIILRNKLTNHIEIVQIKDIKGGIWNLYERFKPYDNTLIKKQQKTCDKYQVYTNDGWSNINKLIRHQTRKKIYRVETYTGIVDVTEDHSLLDENMNEIKPKDLKVGKTKLCYNYPYRKLTNWDKWTNQYVSYPKKHNKDRSLEDVIDFIENIENKDNNIKKAYNYGQFDGRMKYNSYTYSEYKKLCNKCLNNNNYEVRFAYLAGYYYRNYIKKDYNKKSRTYITLRSYSKIGGSILNNLISSLSLNFPIKIKIDDENTDTTTITNYHGIKNKQINKVEKFYYLRDTKLGEYVYDIETDDGNFNVGFPLIVKNTDSVFVKFNLQYDDGTYPKTDIDKIKRSIEIGLNIQQKLKDDKIFPAPHDLEYEKVYYPLILITKKRYIGIKFDFDPEVGEKTSMGVVTKRRDNAPILKHSFIGVTDTLMQDKDIIKSVEFVRGVCRDMVDGLFELNMFVISKTLSEYYKDPESIAHKVLADRMAERDPGNKPSCNERLPYIYIKIDEQPGVSYLQGDKIEHVNYVRDNCCKVDYETYITNQIMKPISQIFELVVEKLPKFPYQKDYFDNLEIKYYNKFNGDLVKTAEKVSILKHKLIKKLLFDDILTYAYNKAHKVNTIDKYFNEASIDKKIDRNKIDINNCVDKTGKKEKFKIKRLKQITIDDMFG